MIFLKKTISYWTNIKELNSKLANYLQKKIFGYFLFIYFAVFKQKF